MTAAGQGLEPQYHPPEGCVLPLDEPAMPSFLSHYAQEGERGSRGFRKTLETRILRL